MKTSIALSSLVMASVCLNYCTAFMDFLSPPCTRPMMESLIVPGSIFKGVLSAPQASSIPETSIFSSSLEMVNTMATQVNQFTALTSDPEAESQLLNDAAHVALDFSGIFRPSKSTMRFFSIGGRLLSLLADYLPDHTIHMEELVIQLFFIFLTGQELMADDDETDFFFSS